MSVSVASDILVYASNRSDARYRASRSLVEKLAGGPELVYLFWPTLMQYMQEATDPQRFAHPLSVRDAISNAAALLERPHVRSPGEASGFWSYFVETLGNHAKAMTFDEAHVATLMRQHYVDTLFTYNPAYKRYQGIQVRQPPA